MKSVGNWLWAAREGPAVGHPWVSRGSLGPVPFSHGQDDDEKTHVFVVVDCLTFSSHKLLNTDPVCIEPQGLCNNA